MGVNFYLIHIPIGKNHTSSFLQLPTILTVIELASSLEKCSSTAGAPAQTSEARRTSPGFPGPKGFVHPKSVKARENRDPRPWTKVFSVPATLRLSALCARYQTAAANVGPALFIFHSAIGQLMDIFPKTGVELLNSDCVVHVHGKKYTQLVGYGSRRSWKIQ